MKKMIVFLSIIMCISMVASDESIEKLFSDTFYVYKGIIKNIPDIKQKQEMYERIDRYNTFFCNFLEVVIKDGVPESLQREYVDFDDPMVENNSYKLAYGLATFHFVSQIRSIRLQNKKNIILNISLPLQQNFILDAHKKVIQSVIESPETAQDALLYLLDQHQEYTDFYKEHLLIDAEQESFVKRKKDCSLLRTISRCVQFFILPMM